MRLILLHGPPAAGKLTIARNLAERSGFALFHNHLVVDAVAALFPFGSAPFQRLRESIWLDLIGEAAAAARDVIFTFAPEPTISADFIPRLIASVEAVGGTVILVQLKLDAADQEHRLMAVDRAAYGKLRDLPLVRSLRPAMAECTEAMPTAALVLDTSTLSPDAAAARIGALLV